MLRDLLPPKFHLSQNYPNPFREETTIKYCLPHQCRVTVTVSDAGGQVIERLVDEEKPAGTYKVIWEPRNLAGGVYFCHMSVKSFRATKKMSLEEANL
jgi:hypothetical protein